MGSQETSSYRKSLKTIMYMPCPNRDIVIPIINDDVAQNVTILISTYSPADLFKMHSDDDSVGMRWV